MKRLIHIQVFILAVYSLLSVSCKQLQVRPEDYIGCFVVSEENRVFISSPGDYDRADMSPLECLQQCGRKYTYGALQSGNICLCADSLPTSGKVDDSECSSSCPGSQDWPAEDQDLKCGGPLRSSIYSATDRIMGLRIQTNGTLPLLEPVTLSGSLVNGRNITFGFELGDGTVTGMSASEPRIRHIYDQPGSYKVTFDASNLVTGTVTSSKVLKVDDLPSDGVQLECPAAVRVGEIVECNGTLTRGSRVNATFQFDDGSNDSFSLSARYYNAGPNIPRENNTAEVSPLALHGTVVMQAYEFRHSGRITHWEFEGVQIGDVTLQVFRPVCSSGETYCKRTKSCVPSSQVCHPSTQRLCPPSQTFCLFRGHCLENTTAGSCPALSPYHTTVPRADYELIWENRVSIAVVGHHIESISLVERPVVNNGDVLGWTSEGGKLAYQEIDPEKGATFEYGLVQSVGDVLRRSDTPIKHHKHFIMSAHYAHANLFSTRRTYQTPGHTFITSNVMGKVMVTNDYPIKDVRMVYTTIVVTNKSYNFSVPSHPGTNTTYLWDFGDGHSLRSQESSVTYTYQHSGRLVVTLTAANSITRIVTTGQISVFHAIYGLGFSAPILAKALGEETVFEWETLRGTNLTYVIDFGDGNQRFESVTTGPRSRTGTTKHKYGAVGKYTVTLFAYNLVGPNISVTSNAVVDVPVQELTFAVSVPHVTSNVYLATGDHMNFTRFVSRGTNVQCTFDFRDDSQPVRSSQESISHKYSKPGSYQVNVSCYNAVNLVHQLLNATVVVQDIEAITGLALSANATVNGTESRFMLHMASGTTFFCSWNFGDGSKTTTTDYSHNGQAMFHRFSKVDTYNVSVTCSNRLGFQHVQIAVPLDIPIVGVSLTGSKHYIRVGESFAVYVTVTKGSRLTYLWNYDDGHTDNAFHSLADTTKPVESTHAYSEDGAFAVSVSVSNSLGTVSRALSDPVEVEHPVVNISLVSDGLVSLTKGNITFRLTLPSDIKPPSNALCVWDFGDGNSTSNTSESLRLSSLEPHTKMHRFLEEGIFVTTVNISNHVSRLVLTMSVIVQRLLQVHLVVGRLVEGVYQPGFGPNRDYFRQHDVVILNVSSQPNDLEYVWDFGNGSAQDFTIGPSVQHVFRLPGTYTLRVVVHNRLAALEAVHQIRVQKPPGPVLLNCSNPTYLGDPSTFTINVTDPGTDVCLILDLADSHVIIFGEPRCRPDILKPNHTFVAANITDTSLTYVHTYGSGGTFHVTLTAHNTASQRITETQAVVEDSPCKKPSVQIENDGTVATPYKMPMSQILVLKNKMAFDCPVAQSIVFTWSVFVVSSENPNDESEPLALPVDTVKALDIPVSDEALEKSGIVLKKRTLPFALLKFKLQLGFIGKDWDLSDVVGSHSVWIKVERSELVPVIEGGRRRAVGYELDMALDGSNSKDPDVGNNKTGISYEWMCRRENERFPSADQAASPKGGCWENGTYTFGGNAEKNQVFTGDFYQNAVYVFRLTIRKDTRVKSSEQKLTVLPGQPPTMVLKCTFNCHKKKNPLEPLNMESKCVDCRRGTKIFYRWILYMKDEPIGSRRRRESVDEDDDDDDGSWTPETDWIANGTSTGISKSNLVINRNTLLSGREYRLRLNAWKRGGEESPGFTEEQFTVNVPPYGGNCFVSPLEGFALDTDFSVRCENWQDPDIPLRYLIELKNGEDIIPLYAGFETRTTAVFSMGKEENNFTMEVRVKVEDAYGMTASTVFTVRVVEPVSVDYSQVIGDMGSSVSDGGDQAALQSTNALNSVLNAKAAADGNDTGAQEERAKFRGEVANMMTKIPADSFDAVSQKGVALQGLTQATGEVTEDAQNATVNALNDMGDYLQNAENDKNLEGTAKNMFSSIGNVVGAASGSAEKAINGTNPGADPSAGMNNTKNSLDVVDKVSGAFLKQLVAGDKAKAIKTPNLDLAIGRKSLEALAGADEEEEEEEDDGDTGGVRLPDPMALFGGANASTEDGATSAIGTTMTAMNKNPFAWDNSSKDLSSKTVGVALTDGNGKPLDLAGQELEVFVPRDLVKNPLKPMEINHFSEDDPPMRVHKFNRSSAEAGIVVEILPFDEPITFMVAVRYGKKPTANHYDFTHTFPTLQAAQKMKRRPHPFTFVISNDLLNNLTGANASSPGGGEMKQFYLGIKALNKDELNNPNISYGLRIYLPSCKMFLPDLNTWTSKGCKVGPKTIANSTHCICQPGAGDEDEEDEDEDPTTEVTDAPTTSSQAPTKRVAKRKRFKKSVSKVSFASSLFVAPNPIDFNKVFNANLLENPIALATVLAIACVYVILAIYSRREDLKDVGRAGVTPLEDNDPSDRHQYEIICNTGFGKKAATTSKVFFTLSGEEGESEPRGLKDPKRTTFQRRGVDEFLATFPQSLGELNYLHIWHDNSGRSPSWYLSRVVVHDLNNDKKYLFICENWLAVEEGDGTVDRLIPVAGHEEMTSFNHLFYSTTQKNLADGHLWFSIFMRPARSRFTRLQRLSCCLTLLYLSMLTNAMFYQIGGESDPATSLQIGPLSFSPAQVGIGIMSSVIIVPVNLLIVGIFRGVEPKPTKAELKERRTRWFWWLKELFFCFYNPKQKRDDDFIEIMKKNHKPDEFLDFSSRTNITAAIEDEAQGELNEGFGLGDEDIDFRISKEERREEEEKKLKKKKKKKKKKKMLPYWWLYVGWTLCFLTCFTAAFFVVLYGLQFGKDKSAQWISSMLVTFFQDVLISQPLKVIAIALVIALIVKKPPEEEEQEDKKKNDDEEWLHDDVGGGESRMKPKTMIRFQPPDKDKLKKAREQRFKEMKMTAVIKEVLLYVFFVACLCIVSYSHRDPTSYKFRWSMEDAFLNSAYGGLKSFESIGNRENFYLWAETSLMNALFFSQWYNGEPAELGYTGDQLAYVIGGARFRQIRVEDQSCSVPSQFSSMVASCHDWYGFSDEDKNQYDVAWEPLKNESLYNPPFTYQAWEYNTSGKLNTMPFMAYVSTYGGGGFVADLGDTRENAVKVIETLKNNTWIDAQTRAVITEISTYNAVSNLFCVMTFVLEFLPTNGVFHYTDFKIARLFAFGGGYETFLMLSEFCILIFFATFIYQELKQLYRMGRGYFKEFWNCLEFVLIVLVLTAVGMFFTRVALVGKAITRLEENPGKFVSFSRVVSWNEAFMYVVASVVFLTWLKGIKLLRFNQRVSVLARTLSESAGPLGCFFVVFLVFFLAYALFAFAIFGQHLSGYYNFVSTCETVLGILLGSFDFLELQESAPVLGPLYFFSFMVFGSFILTNMFLTIVMDVFSDVKGSIDGEDNEYEIVDFMISRFKKVTGLQSNKVVDTAGKGSFEAATKKALKELTISKGHSGKKANFKEGDAIEQKFTRLESSLADIYCDDWTEERILDHFVERRWGVNTEKAYAEADAELTMEQERDDLRLDMYAALDRYGETLDSGGDFLLSFDGQDCTKQDVDC